MSSSTHDADPATLAQNAVKAMVARLTQYERHEAAMQKAARENMNTLVKKQMKVISEALMCRVFDNWLCETKLARQERIWNRIRLDDSERWEKRLELTEEELRSDTIKKESEYQKNTEMLKTEIGNLEDGWSYKLKLRDEELERQLFAHKVALQDLEKEHLRARETDKETIGNAYLELEKLATLVEQEKAKSDACARKLETVKELTKSDSVILESESWEDDKYEFIADAVHKILMEIDPRYLGRSSKAFAEMRHSGHDGDLAHSPRSLKRHRSSSSQASPHMSPLSSESPTKSARGRTAHSAPSGSPMAQHMGDGASSQSPLNAASYELMSEASPVRSYGDQSSCSPRKTRASPNMHVGPYQPNATSSRSRIGSAVSLGSRIGFLGNTTPMNGGFPHSTVTAAGSASTTRNPGGFSCPPILTALPPLPSPVAAQINSSRMSPPNTARIISPSHVLPVLPSPTIREREQSLNLHSSLSCRQPQTQVIHINSVDGEPGGGHETRTSVPGVELNFHSFAQAHGSEERELHLEAPHGRGSFCYLAHNNDATLTHDGPHVGAGHSSTLQHSHSIASNHTVPVGYPPECEDNEKSDDTALAGAPKTDRSYNGPHTQSTNSGFCSPRMIGQSYGVSSKEHGGVASGAMNGVDEPPSLCAVNGRGNENHHHGDDVNEDDGPRKRAKRAQRSSHAAGWDTMSRTSAVSGEWECDPKEPAAAEQMSKRELQPHEGPGEQNQHSEDGNQQSQDAYQKNNAGAHHGTSLSNGRLYTHNLHIPSLPHLYHNPHTPHLPINGGPSNHKSYGSLPNFVPTSPYNGTRAGQTSTTTTAASLQLPNACLFYAKMSPQNQLSTSTLPNQHNGGTTSGQGGQTRTLQNQPSCVTLHNGGTTSGHQSCATLLPHLESRQQSQAYTGYASVPPPAPSTLIPSDGTHGTQMSVKLQRDISRLSPVPIRFSPMRNLLFSPRLYSPRLGAASARKFEPPEPPSLARPYAFTTRGFISPSAPGLDKKA